MSDVPFDLQQLRVILYSKGDPAWGDQLAGKVTAALKETLTTPVDAVPLIFRTPVQSQGPQQDATEARLESLERQIHLLRVRAGSPPRVIDQPLELALREARRILTPRDFQEWVERLKKRTLNVKEVTAADPIEEMIRVIIGKP